MNRRTKSLLWWEDIRKKGMLRYFLVNGMLMACPLYFVFTVLLNVLFSDPEPVLHTIIDALVFGVIFSIASWIMMESRYKRMTK